MVWDALQDNGKEGAKAGYPRGFWCDSVLLIDCEKAKEFVDPIDKIKIGIKTILTSGKL